MSLTTYQLDFHERNLGCYRENEIDFIYQNFIEFTLATVEVLTIESK